MSLPIIPKSYILFHWKELFLMNNIKNERGNSIVKEQEKSK
nr:MAG TPA: Vacuolar import and degradation protein [Caudoviricetes sp.]